MSKLERALLPLLLSTQLARIAAAQIDPQMANQIPPQYAQGLFSNLPIGISMSDAGSTSAWLIRAPGVNGGVPVAWSQESFGAAAPGHPDFSIGALTAHWAPAGTVPSFGGVSTGGEATPAVDAGGRLLMTGSNWYMLAISVDRFARGAPNSLLEGQTANGRNPAGDILSYYAAGSSGINPAFVDTVRLEYSREQLGLQAVPPQSTTSREVQNLDFGLGVIATDMQGRAANMFPVRDCFYFTLTQAWISTVIQLFPSFQIAGAAPSASTIYVMTWSAAGSTWSAPQVAFSHLELFPNSAPGSIEIDALSVDKGTNPPTLPLRAVFSLTPQSDPVGAPFDQLLVYQRSPTICNTTALVADSTSATTTHVSRKLGLRPRVPGPTGEPDNVTGTCGGDPNEILQIGAFMALATSQLRQGAGALGLTAVRQPAVRADATSASEMLHVQISGLDYGTHAMGFAYLQLEGPVVTNGTPQPPTPIGDPIWISPEARARNVVDLTMPLPKQIGTTPLRFSASLYGLDFTPTPTITPLRESWVLSILY